MRKILSNKYISTLNPGAIGVIFVNLVTELGHHLVMTRPAVQGTNRKSWWGKNCVCDFPETIQYWDLTNIGKHKCERERKK